MNYQSRGSADSGLPPQLAEVALIDAKKCAQAGDMSVSWWHIEVREGRAPAPVIRDARCTRWRLKDVAEFWRARAERASVDTSAQVVARATKASNAAKAKRTAHAASSGH